MTTPQGREELREEPYISIKGVLFDIQAGQLTIEEAMKEIIGYFSKHDKELVEFFKNLPYGQSGNNDYDKGWDDCRRCCKDSLITHNNKTDEK